MPEPKLESLDPIALLAWITHCQWQEGWTEAQILKAVNQHIEKYKANDEAQALFRKLRKVSTNATILKLPDYTQLGRFKRLLQDWVDYDQRLLAGHNTPPGEPQVAGKRKKHNRASKPRKHRQLTPRQVEVVQVVGECKGNISQAAKRLGRDRATIEESYRAGLEKLGKTACWNPGKTRLLPRDKRGQDAVAEADDLRRQ